ncbi:asn/thr-rich large protein family protein [Ectocarpus siliculosus]|uniref:Asn/thr-rich large protein family protein n=1 Tax=Ectocarpus siliculosus TaxID=2880 RepID=D7FLJ6_ECTSI|nr:asn/thr-rich large protein family protein [Ectocarpus siliculosus]|eukprot:CBJ25812.1 asn/thr-rich large protein family protein [Ectocarpus siliculosus]
MKTVSLTLIASLLAAPAAAVEYTVATCADLADVDDTQVTSLTIDASTFACDEYTRFRVRNAMTLKATVPAVEFGNFSLKVLGELTVEPDVMFNGVVDQVKNGGVLSVAEGATATFMGTSEFSDNSVAVKQIGPVSCGDGCTRIGRGLSYIVKKGGAIHNKGTLTFEGDATFERNEVHTEDSVEQGKAGAISNTGSGTILFKSKLTMKDNEADGFFEGIGGAIYNRGEIVVEGESLFSLNTSSDGGGIYQTSIGTMTFNGAATFSENSAYDLLGGGLMNDGGVVNINAGSLFELNGASGSGDGGLGGAIYNTNAGVVTLMGSTTFRENAAFMGGAIYTSDGDEENGEPASVTTFPDDTVFEDNSAEHCPDVHNGDSDNCPVV